MGVRVVGESIKATGKPFNFLSFDKCDVPLESGTKSLIIKNQIIFISFACSISSFSSIT